MIRALSVILINALLFVACESSIATPTSILPTQFTSLVTTTVSTITPVATGTASGNVFYVDGNLGSDSSLGTKALPWRTIQKAADTVLSVDTVIVQAGTYEERMIINRSGMSGAPIKFQAQGNVVIHGFTVQADFVTIHGFEITNTPDDPHDGYGIWVQGSGCLIEDNYIHYATRGGIQIFAQLGSEALTANCLVRNNRLYRNAMVGIEIYGRNHVVEGNEIWGTIQYHFFGRSLQVR